MALQGTLDTFALADLVRLLATTEKTGELAVDGDRGQGRLWFREGEVVGGEPATDGDVVGALFALLRMEEGDFRFVADEAPPTEGTARRALEVLQEAEERLEAWRPVEALVPSPAVRIGLRGEIDDDEVRVDAATWGRLVAVAASATAADLAERLGLDDVATAFALHDLAGTGLLVIEPAEEEPAVDDQVADVVEDLDAPTIDAVPAHGIDDESLFVPVEVEPLPTDLAPEADAPTDAEDGWPAGEALPTMASAAELLSSSGPLADDLADIDARALGPWEPIEGADADDAPATLAEALPPVGDEVPDDLVADLPELDAAADPVAEGDGLPSLDSDPAPGSLAVDLDARLGGDAAEHSYLDRDATPEALPEPLPASGADVDDADDAAADRAPWPAPADEGAAQVLSPAAAAAIAAAAEDPSGDEALETGRRGLRRIISTGKG